MGEARNRGTFEERKAAAVGNRTARDQAAAADSAARHREHMRQLAERRRAEADTHRRNELERVTTHGGLHDHEPMVAAVETPARPSHRSPRYNFVPGMSVLAIAAIAFGAGPAVVVDRDPPPLPMPPNNKRRL